MYQRTIIDELSVTMGEYPVVGVLGPRQSGKTTLVRHTFPNKAYVNLEQPDIRLLANEDPQAFLNQYPDGVILDEIQRAPILLSYIQVIVDELPQNGRYIITGSHQLELHDAISQSLAGRIGLLSLYPLSLHELSQAGIILDVNQQMYNGFYPKIYSAHLNPTRMYQNYVQTYLEKDVRRISEIKNLLQFQLFMKLCAGRIGQIFDYSSLSNEIGVSSHTIKHWLSILEASYIIFRLPPYFENFGKRVIKSPKLYFTDVGLACHLLEIEYPSQLTRDPLRGHLFENLVLLELLKYRCNRGLKPNLYYFRDNHGNEIDVIISQGRQLIPIEIKSAQTFNKEFLKGLNYFKKLVAQRCPTGYLIYAGQQQQQFDNFSLINYQNTTDVFLPSEMAETQEEN